MSRQNLTTPFSVLLVGGVIIVMALAGPVMQPQAAPLKAYTEAELNQTATRQAQFNQTATAAYPLTRTAQAQGTVQNTPTNTNTTAPVAGSTNTPTVSTATSVNATNTPSSAGTAIPTTVTAGPTATSATSTAQPVPTPAIIASSTPLVPSSENELSCVPGQPVEIRGEGPPNAGLLMYFNGRAVGGGSARPDGRFTLTLTVGNESAGRYPVSVQVRGSAQVLRDLVCVVPAVTPTPVVTPVVRR